MKNSPIPETEVPKTGIDNSWPLKLMISSVMLVTVPSIYFFKKKIFS